MDPVRLKDSWNAVVAHGDQVPLFFYSTLFLTHPEVRELFPVSMAGQRDRLVQALGSVVSNADQLETVIPVVQQLGRDHRKFGALESHYPAVGEALLATLEHFLGDRWTPEVAADWTAAYGVVAQVMMDAAREAAKDSPPWWEAEVVSHEQRIVDIAVLRLRPNYRLPYRPGQSVSVETPTRPRLWRFYTPANMPAEDGLIELHVRTVDGGAVSGALVQNTQAGDVLRLGHAVGEALTLDPSSDRDLLLLAGGTGVAPMKALIQQVAAEGGNRNVHLYWGVRWGWELYDLDAIAALDDEHDWLHVVTCASVQPDFDGPRSTAVDAARRAGPWRDHDVYVCGSPAMVRGSVDGLGATVAPDRIHTEQFATEEEQR